MTVPVDPSAEEFTARRAATDRIDAQILANWIALRRNPDLDAAHVMRVIDRLLDERAVRTGAEARAGRVAETGPFPD